MCDGEHWRPAPKDLSLPEKVVHVWRAELVSASLQLLSSDERERAAQFHFERDRNRYIAARAILRQLIGRYERLAPQTIQFSYNKFGKPALESSTLRFNTSHSAGIALFAFARNSSVGVDLERIQTNFAPREIAAQFFADEEIAAMCELPATSQTQAFFKCWTRKEALIKAHGSGLSLPLHKFAVSVDGPARLLRTDLEPGASAQWTLHDLPLGGQYAAALAVQGEPARIECWQWAGEKN